jgi:hypothetical protein
MQYGLSPSYERVECRGIGTHETIVSCGDNDEGSTETRMRRAFIMKLPTIACYLICCNHERGTYGLDYRFERLKYNRECDLKGNELAQGAFARKKPCYNVPCMLKHTKCS